MYSYGIDNTVAVDYFVWQLLCTKHNYFAGEFFVTAKNFATLLNFNN